MIFKNRIDYFFWRKTHHITLKQVAKFIKCSQSLICKFEQDKICMSDEKLSLYNEYIKMYER